MTKEEAICILNGTYDYSQDKGYDDAENAFKYVYEKMRFADALEMAIKALEQEPCEDAVSRAEALEALNSINGTSEIDKVCKN